MKKMYFIAMIVLLSCGCSTQRNAVNRTPVIKDSIVQKLIPFTVPSDTATIKASFYVDSASNQIRVAEYSEYKSNDVKSDFKFSKNQLSYSVTAIHDTLYVPSTYEYKEVPVEVIKEVKTNVLTSFQKKEIWLGRAFSALLMCFLLSKLNWKTILKALIKLLTKK